MFKNPFSADHTPEARAKALWERAQKHFEGRLFNRAITDLQDALQLNPAYAKEAYEMMQVLSAQGQDEQSVSIGMALLKINATDHELFNRLGNSLRRLGDFTRAKNVYTQALKVKSNFLFARYNLAACFFGIATADADLVKQTQAVETLTKPRRFDFQGGRAGLVPLENEEFGRGDAAKGKDAASAPAAKADRGALRVQLTQDLQQAPGSWQAEYNLGLLLDLMGLGDEAIAHLKQAYTHDPNHPAPVNNLAVALLVHKNNLEAAEMLLAKAQMRHPYERTIVLNLALVSKRANKALQILKYFVYLGELLAQSHGEFDIEKVRAHADDLFERHKYVEAIPQFELIAKEHPQADLLEKLAAMYLSQKHQDAYLHTLVRLVKLDPNNKEARQKISDAAKACEDEAHEKLEKGNKAQAAQLIHRAVQIEENADRWVELAQLYEELGEEILAGNALRRWKELTVKPASHPPSAAKAP
jgi:tetratricopeptide (TPR) repeat protein